MWSTGPFMQLGHILPKFQYKGNSSLYLVLKLPFPQKSVSLKEKDVFYSILHLQ